MKICKVEGCKNKHFGLEYCQKHYMQIRTHGEIQHKNRMSPNDIISIDDHIGIVLRDNAMNVIAVAKIDFEDLEMVKGLKWRSSHGLYAVGQKGKFQIELHRLIMRAKKGEYVDHINHDGFDCRKNNMRICSQRQNLMNTRKRRLTSSKYKGVSITPSKKWRSRIMLEGKEIWLGVFDNEEEAALAYNKKAFELFGEFAYLNEIK